MSEERSDGPAPGGPQVVMPESLIGRSLSGGWEAFKHDPILLVGFFLLKAPLACAGAWILSGGYIHDFIFPHGYHYFEGVHSTLYASLLDLFDGVLTAGLLYTALRVVRRQPAPFSTLFSGFTRFIPVVLAHILVKIAVGFGVFFFIVPGIILALGFSQWAFLIMDRDADCITALSGSWRMMKGYKAEFFLLWLVLIGINIVGILPLGLGLFLTVPFTMATQAAFYDQLILVNPPREG
jgi:uncharacterized membrane protein